MNKNETTPIAAATAATARATESKKLKSYETPKFYIYGEIERQTQGGSGMTKEGIGSAVNKFP